MASPSVVSKPAVKRSGKNKAAKAAAAPARAKHVFNARPDTLDFRDRMYVPTLIEVPTSIELSDYLKHKVPVLDQGAEGACTGFGLATVANYLLACRVHKPDHTQVSPRMFYELARRYDEWPGEDYSGSSARGAMKGWNKHGVCAESDWRYQLDDDAACPGFNEERMKAAKRRPLGAYFRVNHRDLIAMHAAIAEVRVLYATAMVHEGWNQVGEDGVITMSDHVLGGHAFAIVAYNEQGFWIQNSWGETWGRGGLALITYDDWLKNGTDVWVARLGAPVSLTSPVAFATAHASTSGQTVAYTYADLRPHLVSVGNDGRLRAGGDYGTTERELDTIFSDDIPRFMDGSDKKCLLLFAHGGLVDEDAAVQRVAEYRKTLLDAGVYPLAFIWNTDYWSTVTNILQDAVRRRRPEGLIDKAKDFMLDRLDDAIEPLARALSGRAAWTEMKENAIAASSAHGAARLVVKHILKLREMYPALELHVVGHSAGSILHAPIVQLLGTEGKIKSGPMKGATGAGLTISTCTLWAPACTTALFHETYAPVIKAYDEHGASGIANFSMFCLNDKAEQSDHCARIYNKSLLYLVSNAFESQPRIPAFRDGEPILGMERFVRADAKLLALFNRPNAELVVAPNNEAEASLNASTARHHGDFDDDKATVSSTFNRILGARDADEAEAEINIANLNFATSAASLTRTRHNIDEQTRLRH